MSLLKCQQCGLDDLTDSATFCYGCGNPIVRGVPIQPVGQTVALKLDCTACKTFSVMTATKVDRFSPVIRVIGGLMLVPSFLGIGFAGLMLLSALWTGANAAARGDSAYQAGVAIGAGIGLVFSLFVGVVSFVCGVIGWIFLLKRNVWMCERCGFIIDRA